MNVIGLEQYPQLTRFETPWPHYIIDKFLDDELYNKIISLRKHDRFNTVDSYVKGVDNVYQGTVPNQPVKNNLLLQSFKNIDIRIKQTIDAKLKTILPKQYFCINDLIRCDPGYKYLPHKDHRDKKVSIVTFLHPLMSNATVLQKNNVEYELRWRPNRALVFTQEEHGMHYYKNHTEYPRLTMNTYITIKSNAPFNVKDI